MRKRSRFEDLRKANEESRKKAAGSAREESLQGSVWGRKVFEQLSEELGAALRRANLSDPTKLDAWTGDLDDNERIAVLSEIMGTSTSALSGSIIEEFLETVEAASSVAGVIRHHWAKNPFSEKGYRDAQPTTSPLEDKLVLCGMKAPKMTKAGQQRKFSRRGAMRRKAITDTDARAKLEEKERERWIHRLGLVIQAADLPVARHARESMDEKRALSRCAAGKRSGTIRDRVRKIEKMQEWLLSSGASIAWPNGVQQVADYLETLAAEPCARTVPQGIMSSIKFLETAGGVPVESSFGDNGYLKSVVKELEVELCKAGGVRERKKAQLFAVTIIMGLELLVTTEREEVPLYAKAIAWVKLLKIWTAMRSDDTRGLIPHGMRLSARGLEAYIERTKTTGIGKRAEVKFIWVSHQAFLADERWLEVGYAIWQSEPMNFARDYLVPVPNSNWSGPRHRPADYHDLAVMTRWLWNEVRRPVRHAGAWQEDSECLFHIHPGTFYSEHCERNWLDTWAASLSIPKDDRDKLGWNHESSDEYVRSARRIVETIQVRVAEFLQGDHVEDLGDEESVLERLRTYYLQRGEDPEAIRDQITRLQYCRRPTFPRKSPTEAVAVAVAAAEKEVAMMEDPLRLGDIEKEVELEETISGVCTPMSPQTPGCHPDMPGTPQVQEARGAATEDEAEQEEQMEIPAPGLIISITGKRKFRRLHRWKLQGGCSRWPGVDYREFERVPKNSLDSADYDDFCKSCWRGTKTPQETTVEDEPPAAISSSSEDESPSSSDPEEAEEEDEEEAEQETDGRKEAPSAADREKEGQVASSSAHPSEAVELN